jgi:tRNA-binding protein
MSIPIRKPDISWADFEKLDIRVGTVTDARPFPGARKPAYQLEIDLGLLGILRSSAQITSHYRPEDLIGRQVIVLVNLPKKQIANFFSECLVMGIYDESGAVILLDPDKAAPNGAVIG